MLLKKAENLMAYAKVGLLGFPGSGKTFTSSLIAIGICKAVNNNKVAYFDTETGSDFLLGKLKENGIEVFQVKSRSFEDLLTVIKECEMEGIGVLIIDSITHVWRDLCDSYDKKLKRNGRLQFQDWALIKGVWKTYTDAFVNSKLHILVAGRSGYEYDYDFNEDGTKDLIKTGTRMKVESEFGFEPSLVLEMERTTESKDEIAEIKGMEDKNKKRQRKQIFNPTVGSKWIHRCHVLKDRTDTIDGMTFDNPTFDDFMPHFEKLNIGGQHFGIDTTRDSSALFNHEGKPAWKVEQELKEVIRAEVKALIDKHFPSTSASEKRAKILIKEQVFGCRSDESIDVLGLEALRDGSRYLEWLLKDESVVKALLDGKSTDVWSRKAEEWKIYNSDQAQ